MNDIQIRPFVFPTDYEAVVQLWDSAGEGIRLQRSDQPEEIQKKIARDPDLFLVACDAGKIIGTVIGGFDGRRGTIYHLAVEPEYRRKGLATRLMAEVESLLKAKGCIRCYLFVTPKNQLAMQFYSDLGWERMTIIPFAKDLLDD